MAARKRPEPLVLERQVITLSRPVPSWKPDGRVSRIEVEATTNVRGDERRLWIHLHSADVDQSLSVCVDLEEYAPQLREVADYLDRVATHYGAPRGAV